MVKPLKETFPLPHAKIDIELKTIRAGTRLFRLHASRYAGNQFNSTGYGDARFSPIRHKKSQAVIPTLYAGETTEVAICEVLFHDLDVSRQAIFFEQARLKHTHHTELETLEELTLAVISQVSVVRMRAR